MPNKPGIFTISLDFELYWGVRDKRKIQQYSNNILGVRKAIPSMLSVFKQYDIHATWASVGFLFFNNRNEAIKNFPDQRPSYKDEQLCPYRYIENSEELDPRYHFAPELIQNIHQCKGQEIGTHTLSHYYCLEPGQTQEEFERDIQTAMRIANKSDVSIKSMVFPRNQWNTDYLDTLRNNGIQCFRGNETGWIYRASNQKGQSHSKRALRLLDSYFNISGYNTYSLKSCTKSIPFNFPASRFLRPYSKKLSMIEWLRIRRIKKAMTHAAKTGEIFHLWWHPHNFGTNTEENIRILKQISEHYAYLKRKYNMHSLNMGELSEMATQQ